MLDQSDITILDYSLGRYQGTASALRPKCCHVVNPSTCYSIGLDRKVQIRCHFCGDTLVLPARLMEYVREILKNDQLIKGLTFNMMEQGIRDGAARYNFTPETYCDPQIVSFTKWLVEMLINTQPDKEQGIIRVAVVWKQSDYGTEEKLPITLVSGDLILYFPDGKEDSLSDSNTFYYRGGTGEDNFIPAWEIRNSIKVGDVVIPKHGEQNFILVERNGGRFRWEEE